jgi:large subunit ribosomal protein L22
MANVRAEARYLPISAQKLRLVCDQVRGLNAEQALVVLQFVPKKGAKFVHKLITSALANAENNFDLAREDMTVATIMVGGGPMLKRFKAGARGRYKPRLRRTSHLTIILSDGGENS